MRHFFLPIWSALIGALLFLGCQQVPAPRAVDALPPAPELGLHAYTFRRLSYLETLDQARALGIRYLQLYPGQRLGAEPEPKVHHQQDEATRQWIREQAEARGITLLSYFIRRAQDEAEWRQAFSFAQAIGARELATAPPPDQLPLLDRLSRETGLIVSLYNTPTPSPYADPEVALAAIAPYGSNLRLSGDAGHWARSGFEPVAAFRRVAGKMFTAQVKDLKEHGVRRARDVPWGTGISNISGQIAELRRQRFEGVVFIDYEYDSPALEDEVRRSIEFFQRAWAAPEADLLAGRVLPPGYTARPEDLWQSPRGRHSERWPAPQPLLAPDLANADFAPGTWAWVDDVLVSRGGSELWTRESYGDFVLSLEFRCEAGAEGGVWLRGAGPADGRPSGLKVQILQGDTADEKHLVGALFGALGPTRRIEIVPGQWHHYTLMAQGGRISVWLDRERILHLNLDQWREAGRNPDGSPNAWATPGRELPRSGRIGLQDPGPGIAFRHLSIEKL